VWVAAGLTPTEGKQHCLRHPQRVSVQEDDFVIFGADCYGGSIEPGLQRKSASNVEVCTYEVILLVTCSLDRHAQDVRMRKPC
jgi:hypothetical protein